jgi:hypothetical protein
MNRGPASAMDIHERLSVFDGWLTGRIEEAHATRKDLAFRDLSPEESARAPPWEYSLLEPGARSPIGEGWSVYRFSGVMPELPPEQRAEGDGSSTPGRRSVIDMIAGAVLGRTPRR